MNCERYLEELVAAALGETSETLRLHLATCRGCRHKLAQFSKIAESLQAGYFNAPAELIRRAQEIQIIGDRRNLVARLLSASFAGAGARLNETSAFQLLFEAENRHIRMMYTRDGKDWQVVGQVPADAGWSIFVGDSAVQSDSSGRFSFRARNLEGTGIRCMGADFDIYLPPASEVSESDAGGSD